LSDQNRDYVTYKVNNGVLESCYANLEIQYLYGETGILFHQNEIIDVCFDINGAVGSTGERGSVGLDGATGPQGHTGSQGSAGLDGSTGIDGPQGHTGSQGHTGVHGQDGATGADGATGVQGPQGITGPQGPDGSQGTSLQAYGEISADANVTTSSLTTTFAKITVFGSTGLFLNTTPSPTDDQITVGQTGIYQALCSGSLSYTGSNIIYTALAINDTVQSKTRRHFSVNDSTQEFTNSGLFQLNNGENVSLHARTATGTATTTFEYIDLMVMKIADL